MSKKKKKAEVEIEDKKVEVTIENTESDTPSKEEKTEPTLEEQLEELNQQITEQKDKYLRLFAEFDNFKKRTAKERLDLIQTAGKDVMLSIIPTLDDLERAEQSASQATDVQAVREGFNLVRNKLFTTLQQKGLKPMESKGQEFNPDLHEALTKIPAPSKDMKGKIIDEIEKGYILNEKIIRFAKVVVGE